ncbi:MAG: flagellar basal body rod protein FlgC [Bauldia sp.]
MDFTKSMMIAASGLRAQAGRMRVLAENIANVDSTSTEPGGDPYRRKIATFRTHFDRAVGANVVELGRVRRDPTSFRSHYDPGNPGANELGYVKMPNVNDLIEAVDMRDAQRTYEANLNVISAARGMIGKTLDILRG